MSARQRLEQALVELRRAVSCRTLQEDPWAFLTAIGVGQEQLGAAESEVAWLQRVLGLRAGMHVLDIGSGIGRHLVHLRDAGMSVRGFETSALLVRASQSVVPSAIIQHDGRDAYHIPPVDLVLIASDTLGLKANRRADVAVLRHARASLSATGVVAVQLSDPSTEPAPVVATWERGEDLETQEHVTSTAEGELLHEFTCGRYRFFEKQTLYTHDEVAALAEESGLKLALTKQGPTEGYLWHILQPVDGFNFLSDLPAFLSAWSTPEHPRNQRRADSGSTSDDCGGSESSSAGRGPALTPHNPGFVSVIDDGVRDLVLTFVDSGLITYSSCSGHETGGDRYVGILASTLEVRDRWCERMSQVLENSGLADVELRSRQLMGPTGELPVLDIVIPRRGDAWHVYKGRADRVTDSLVTALLRNRSWWRGS